MVYDNNEVIFVKKFLVLFIVIILVVIAVFLGLNYLNDNDSMKNVSDIESNNDENDNNINSSLSNNNANEEENNDVEYNSTLYIGTENNFKEYGVDINKEADVMEQAKQIVEEIGAVLGYNIEVVDIVNGKGGITVNFSSNSAPFNMDSYVGNGKVEISDEKNLVYTIFDSIQKTLKEYFGGNPDIWYVVEDQEITIDTIEPELYLPYEEPYQGSNAYK